MPTPARSNTAATTPKTPATDAAVVATTGDVVTYAGVPVTTYYFASSGGETENVQNAMAGVTPEPYLKAVLDPYDTSRFGPITMTLHQAARRLRGLLEGRLRSIVVTRRGASPRIISATVVGSGGSTTVSGLTLVNALGIHSTWACFTVTRAARLASGWDQPCAKPSKIPTSPPAPTGSTSGGAVAPSGLGGDTPPAGASGPSGPSGPTGPSGTTTATRVTASPGGGTAEPTG